MQKILKSFHNLAEEFLLDLGFEPTEITNTVARLEYPGNPNWYIFFTLTGEDLYRLVYHSNVREDSFEGLGEAELDSDFEDMVNSLVEDSNSSYSLTEAVRLDEKSLLGSMKSKRESAIKEIEGALKKNEDAYAKLEAEKEELEKKDGFSEDTLQKSVGEFSSNALKALADLKTVAELYAAVGGVVEGLKEARSILGDKEYIKFCNEIDDNTGLFGGSKGKLKANGEDLTSGKASKAFKKKKEAVELNEWNPFKKKKREDPKDVTEQYQKFVQDTEKVTRILVECQAVAEMLKNDPEYKKAMASRKMKLMLGLGAVSAVAGIVASAGAAGLVGSGVAAAAAAIAKGAVIARLGTNVVSTMNNKNLSLGKRMLLVAPLIMSIAFTAGVKLPIPDKPQEPSAADNEKFIAEGETNGADAADGADDNAASSDESRTLSNDEYYGGNAGPQNAPSDSTDDLDGNDISGDSSGDDSGDSSDDSSGDSGNESVDNNFKNIPGSNPDRQITGSAIKDLDPKMQCKNNIRDVAKAEEGMWLQRKDGTYWKLTRGDIKWAQDHLPPKDAETVSVEKAEEVVVDPLSDEDLAHSMGVGGNTALDFTKLSDGGKSEVIDRALKLNASDGNTDKPIHLEDGSYLVQKTLGGKDGKVGTSDDADVWVRYKADEKPTIWNRDDSGKIKMIFDGEKSHLSRSMAKSLGISKDEFKDDFVKGIIDHDKEFQSAADSDSLDSFMQSRDLGSDDVVTTDSLSYKRMVNDTENLEHFKVGKYDVVMEKADKVVNRDPGYLLYKDGKLFKTGSVTEDDPAINKLLAARKD